MKNPLWTAWQVRTNDPTLQAVRKEFGVWRSDFFPVGKRLYVRSDTLCFLKESATIEDYNTLDITQVSEEKLVNSGFLKS